MSTPQTELAADHEAHGHCQNCRYPAHRYPYGWDHTCSGRYACSDLSPVATCCDEHAEATAVGR